MKKLIVSLALLTITATFSQLAAQITTPSPSPKSMITQTVGLTDISVEYSRPSMKGRTIYGADALVPYGKVWRTGANAATKVTFSKDVTIEGQALEAGSYALFTTPGASSWKVHFFDYTTTRSGGYGDATADVVATVTPVKVSHTFETMSIAFDNLTSESADLQIIWDNIVVPIKVGVNTDKDAMASIEKTLAGPTKGDYYSAGVYMASKDRDLKKALEYIQMSTSGDDPKFWQVRNESEVLAKLGEYKKAMTAAEKSMSLAEKAGNESYVKINKDNIAKWSKMK